MIISDHLQDIEARLGDDQFLRPDYSKYSFAQIPALVELLLGTKQGDHRFADMVLPHINPQPQNVVVLLIDGFGYNQWLRYGEQHPFLSRIIEKGNIMPITALFPSTTAASVTTISSGLTPQEHGLVEWHLYLEELDEIIVTLPFMPLAKKARADELAERGVDPRVLFDGISLYTRLSNQGIASHALLRNTYANSAYSKVSQAGANVIPFSSSSDMMVLLRQCLVAAKGKSYFYVYWDGLDHMSHEYEPHSEAYLAELNSLTHVLQTELVEKVDRNVAENTVLLITADHGHVVMKPEETLYLNDWPEVTQALSKSATG